MNPRRLAGTGKAAGPDDRIGTSSKKPLASFLSVFSFYAALFRGTFAPFLRASDSPMAMACLRLLTLPPFPPGPDRKLPRFDLRTALATVFPAAFPYFR
jgi:hypothetical protein